jgi:hypothetical protein
VASGIAQAVNSYGWTAIAPNFDDDEGPDIDLACDSTPSLLFSRMMMGRFAKRATLRGVAYSEDGQQQAVMGLAVSDYHLDGRSTRLDSDKVSLNGFSVAAVTFP